MADNVIMAEARGMSPHTGEQTMILVIQKCSYAPQEKGVFTRKPYNTSELFLRRPKL